MRVAPGQAVTFTVYEYLKERLDKTGASVTTGGKHEEKPRHCGWTTGVWMRPAEGHLHSPFAERSDRAPTDSEDSHAFRSQLDTCMRSGDGPVVH